jgi:hypothetical protein
MQVLEICDSVQVVRGWRPFSLVGEAEGGFLTDKGRPSGVLTGIWDRNLGV